MTINELYEKIRVLTYHIEVLEAERTTSKFVQPFYEEREKYLTMLRNAEGDK